jgi:UDP-N-acetylmuramoyl-tripeptide--D-alanyl-D-alanine ligase
MHYSFDSRQCVLGDTFIALKGERVDGHTYLEMAAKNGAKMAIVSKEYTGDNFGLELIRVDSPLFEIQNRARQSIKERGAFVVAVTGSVGKTTTKEFISEILGRYYRVAKTLGNANTQISMPVAILNADPKAEVFVLEMGASEPGNLDALISVAPPDFAVLTHISHSHTEFFGDLDGVAKEKKKIFTSPNLKWGAASVQTNVRGHKIVTYGPLGDYDFVVETLPFTAQHLIEDFLGAFAICSKIGLTKEQILAVAPDLKPYAHRFEKIEKKGIVFIDDSYNASLASFLAAFKALPITKGRRIGVIGEMREMGDYTKQAHQAVAKEALNYLDTVLCIGGECAPIVKIFKENNRPSILFQSKLELKKALFETIKEGDLVLLKGANSFKLWEMVDDASFFS